MSDGLGIPLRTPLEDMPFISDAMREGAKGIRTRDGVELHYFASGSREVPWGGWEVDTATDSWTGYGAWNDWSGFGLFMLAHDHSWDLYDSAWYHVIAGGDQTGAPPGVSATYRGAAVAIPDDLSFIADGSAALTATLGATSTIDVALRDWQGYTLNDGGQLGAPIDVSAKVGNVNASNIPIESDGTWTFFRHGTLRMAEGRTLTSTGSCWV